MKNFIKPLILFCLIFVANPCLAASKKDDHHKNHKVAKSKNHKKVAKKVVVKKAPKKSVDQPIKVEESKKSRTKNLGVEALQGSSPLQVTPISQTAQVKSVQEVQMEQHIKKAEEQLSNPKEESSSAASKKHYLQEAQYYFLFDPDTKEVLLARNPDARIAPSSMTKLMTAYVVFNQVKNGRISFDSQCLIGKDAFKKRGSSMFLNYGDVVTIDELLQGLLAVSGNDAAVALAETTAGGFENFITLMNIEAKKLGMDNSHFRNPHGLAEEGHYMSMRDLATLTAHLYQDFPEYSHYLGIEEFTYNKVTQRSRNPLIKSNYEGTLGGKTGHTDEGGYGVVGVVKRDDRRLIAVVNKARTPKQRAQIITELMDYGFEKYKKLTLFDKDQVVANAKTWLGTKTKVDIMVGQKVAINVPRDIEVNSIKAIAKYRGPIYAPIKKGAQIATLVIEIDGYKTLEYPLFAKEKIDKVGYLRRMNQILRYKIASFFGGVF